MAGRRSKPYDETLMKALQDDEFVIEYLNATLAEDGIEKFYIALDQVVKAHQLSGSQLEKRSGIPRSTIHQILSEKANPTFATLNTLAGVLGLQFQVARVRLRNS